MKFSKVFLTALLAGLSLFAAAAELTFDLKINRGAPVDYNPRIKKQTIAVFVIDCSGSMREEYGDSEMKIGKYHGPSGREPAWSRAKLVAEKMLPERFEALPGGTQVIVCLYSVRQNEIPNPFVVRKAIFDTPAARTDFLRKLQAEILDRVEKDGLTPYFDTMEMVLKGIRARGWLESPNVDLMLFDYTDGQNTTGAYRGFSYPSNNWGPGQPEKWQRQYKVAKERFDGKWGSFLKKIAKKGFYEQLNLGRMKENPGVPHIPAYKVHFSCDKSGLKSPGDVPAQKVPLYVTFSVNRESWDLLRNGPQGVLKVQFGNGPVRSYPVSLGVSEKPFPVPVPPEALNKEIPVTVSFDCPKGVDGKFTLSAPAPVKFYLPGSKRGVAKVKVGDRELDGKNPLTVLKGRKVFFNAEGSAENYVWKFYDLDPRKDPALKFVPESRNGEVVSCVFGRTGLYKFGVSPKGDQALEKIGFVKVEAIGLTLVPYDAKKVTVPGRDVPFEAVPDKDALRPSSCAWYIVPPVPVDAKEVAPPIPLLARPNDPLRNVYAFPGPGKYTVMVAATYDKFPEEAVETTTPWIVSLPAKIEFSKSMEGEGHTFEFGEPVKLAVDVKEGKIDVASVRWFADGKELPAAYRGQLKIDAPPVRGQGKLRVAYSVKATDPVMKREVTLGRTYFFGCNHPEKLEAGSFRVGEKTASGAFRLYDKVEFRLTKGKYKDIIWTFGDDGNTGKPDAGQQSVVHVMSKAGKFPHTVVCKCAKCGKEFNGSLETDTESKDPKPVLSLKPAKTSYVKGDKVLLCDTGTGDYFKCRLLKWNPEKGDYDVYKDGLDPHFEVEISLGGEEFPVPVGRTDFKFQLQALDREGKTVLKEAERTIRVRPSGLVATVISLVAGVVFIIVFRALGKLLLNNEALGWELHHAKDAETMPPLDVNESQRVGAIRPPVRLNERKRWKRATHEATVPLSTFLSGYPQEAKLVIAPLVEVKQKRMYLKGVPHTEEKLPCNPDCIGKVFVIDDGERKEYLELVLDMSRNYHGDSIIYWTVLGIVGAALVVGGIWLFYF